MRKVMLSMLLCLILQDTSFTQKMSDQNSGMYVAVMDKNGSLKIGTENLSINDRYVYIQLTNTEKVGMVCLLTHDSTMVRALAVRSRRSSSSSPVILKTLKCYIHQPC